MLDPTRLQELADKTCQKTGLVGLGIGLLGSDGPPQVAVSGLRRKASKHWPSAAIQSNELWHIGSVGKSITALSIARLFGAGDPQFATPIAALLPDLSIHKDWHACTLHHVLTGTSGLPVFAGLAP